MRDRREFGSVLAEAYLDFLVALLRTGKKAEMKRPIKEAFQSFHEAKNLSPTET
jgi:hypothetical protein